MIGRLEVLPGPGTAARYGELAVWAGAGASADLLSFLIQSARNLASLPDGGRRIADHLAGVLRQRDPEPAIPFVTVGPGEYTPITLLHGPVQMWDGARWVRPDPGIGWLVAEVSNLTTVLVTPNDTPAPPSANPILDLKLGVVPGGGLAVVLTPSSMMPAEDQPGAKPVAAEAGTTGEASTSENGTAEPEASRSAAPEIAAAGAAGLAGGALAAREAETHQRTTAAESPAAQVEEDRAGEPTAPEEPHPGEESPPEVDVDGNPGSPGTETAPEAETALPEHEAPEGTPSAAAAEEADGDLGAAPVEPTETVESIETTDLRATPSDSWTPLPLADAATPNPPGDITVRGLYCPRGHFNHGGAVTCVHCGLPLDPIRGEGEGPRPVLGVLVGTDRSLWRIDTSYLAGTHPDSDPVVVNGQARPLVVAEDGQAQAVHAELRAADWTLSVLDRNSRSGTFVLPPGHSDWQRVPPDQAVTVKPGTHVAIGSTVFTFTSPWPL